MRCKKHYTDLSSSVGVCASCLRERLFSLIAAQAKAQSQSQQAHHPHAQAQFASADHHHRKSDANRYSQPPLVFPRSVSPYISRRKSDTTAAWSHHQHPHSLPDHMRFYSTPQVGPNGSIIATGSGPCKKKHHHRFSLFSNLFRSKSNKTESDTHSSYSNSDPRFSVSNAREATVVATLNTSTSTSSWFSGILSGRRRKQSRLFSLDEPTNATTAGGGGLRIQPGHRDRGMSPARYSEDGEDECRDESSGYSSESSQWKQTPRRKTQPDGRPSHARNVSGLAFCLSPLVRASPNRHWNQKGMPPETAFSGEIRVPVKPHISNASAFCANRSRKLADFGRFNPNH